MIVMHVPAAKRIELLTREYSQFPESELLESVAKIRKRLGGQNVKRASDAIERGDFETCARICLDYYDKSYGKGTRYRSQREHITDIEVADPHAGDVTQQLMDWADRMAEFDSEQDEPIQAIARRGEPESRRVQT